MSNPLTSLVDAVLVIEKLRIAIQIRLSHLKLQHNTDPESVELYRRLTDLEKFVDGRIAKLLESHPAYPWFSKVKGVGKENIAKVVAQVRVRPAPEDPEKQWAQTPSALWKFAGFSVEDGHAPKRTAGQKLPYNSQLRTMCWRLGTSLLQAGLRQQCLGCNAKVGAKKLKQAEGKCPTCGHDKFKAVAITKFGDYYLSEKAKYESRYTNRGISIVPSSSLPKQDDKRYEPDNMISEGHVHNQALRKMIKLFLSCLWVAWREAEGLPFKSPYAIEQLGHNSYIGPWEMTDN